MSNNSSKGAAKLASVLQSRMNKVSGRNVSLTAELGSIIAWKKLIVDSLPDVTLDEDDYCVCQTINETSPLKNGDRVLVIWTNDGDAVVIDKIVEADEL